MRAAANVPKDSLTQKKKVSVTITQASTEQEGHHLGACFKKEKKSNCSPY